MNPPIGIDYACMRDSSDSSLGATVMLVAMLHGCLLLAAGGFELLQSDAIGQDEIQGGRLRLLGVDQLQQWAWRWEQGIPSRGLPCVLGLLCIAAVALHAARVRFGPGLVVLYVCMAAIYCAVEWASGLILANSPPLIVDVSPTRAIQVARQWDIGLIVEPVLLTLPAWYLGFRLLACCTRKNQAGQ